MAKQYPDTIVLRDPHEHTWKCSIYPLKGKREDVIFYTYPPRNELDLNGYVRLAPDGPELSEADRSLGILLLDASWRRSRPMMRDYSHIPARSLNGFQTAFPRVSKLGTDPQNGLATIEALYVAYHILGRPTEAMLDHYRWKDEFLALNGFSRPEEPSDS